MERVEATDRAFLDPVTITWILLTLLEYIDPSLSGCVCDTIFSMTRQATCVTDENFTCCIFLF